MPLREVRRLSGVAVVEADDVEPRLDQVRAELVWPELALDGEYHDQQQWLAGAGPDPLPRELDRAVRGGPHTRSPTVALDPKIL